MGGSSFAKSVQPTSANQIRVRTNGLFLSALIDTGASRSVVSLELLKKLNIWYKPLKRGDLASLAAAGGTLLKILGTVELDIEICGQDMKFEFYVLRNLQPTLILGMNFLKHYEANIDCKNNSISFNNDAFTVQFETACGDTHVSLINECWLKPMSETIVPVQCSSVFNDEGMITPREAAPDDMYGVARLLVRPENGKTICRILNPTKEVIRLEKGLVVGKIESIEDEITEIETGQTRESSCNDDTRKSDKEILQSLEIKTNEGELNVTQQEQLDHLIAENADIFAKSIADLPGTTLHHHRINTGDAAPKRQRGYKHSPLAKKEIERQTQEMLDTGIIEPSHSMWAAPCVLVKKKSGELRLVIDYRFLNSVTKEISFPLPLMTDILDAMSESQPTIFSLLDLKSGYHQIPMEEASKEKTAFTTHLGQFQYRVMPFGLMNAPSSFQMLMSQVFSGINFKYLICYIDDLLVYFTNFDAHLKHLKVVFDRLRDARLRLHPKKCNFAVPKVIYLGHILSKDGVSVDEAKIEVVKNYPTPKCVKDVRSFLGFCGFYRKFVKGFSQIATPLHRLTDKGREFHWSEDCDNAFKTLRTALITAPILVYADMNKPFVITTDASSNGNLICVVAKG